LVFQVEEIAGKGDSIRGGHGRGIRDSSAPSISRDQDGTRRRAVVTAVEVPPSAENAVPASEEAIETVGASQDDNFAVFEDFISKITKNIPPPLVCNTSVLIVLANHELTR